MATKNSRAAATGSGRAPSADRVTAGAERDYVAAASNRESGCAVTHCSNRKQGDHDCSGAAPGSPAILSLAILSCGRARRGCGAPAREASNSRTWAAQVGSQV